MTGGKSRIDRWQEVGGRYWEKLDYRTCILLYFVYFIFQKCICEFIISYACHGRQHDYACRGWPCLPWPAWVVHACHGRLVATSSPEHMCAPVLACLLLACLLASRRAPSSLPPPLSAPPTPVPVDSTEYGERRGRWFFFF